MYNNPLKCIFKFHPVGQGCFFTGRLFRNGNEFFNFVYDCGSLTARAFLNEQIVQYKLETRSNGKPQIDLIIVSHFDEDHINGLVDLLSNTKVGTLILPYYSIYERLTIFAKGSTKADWHKNFLQNPQEFLNNGDYDIDRVIFVDGTQNDGNIVTNVPLNPNPGLGNSKDYTLPYTSEENTVTNNKFQYYRMPYALEIEGWSFRFYIKPFSSMLIGAFHDALLKSFPDIKISELFSDSARLKIKAIYLSIFKDVNKTSLCVSIKKKEYAGIYYHSYHNYDFDERKRGFLLTGDSSLLNINDIDQFTDYYRDDLKDTLVFQIPHHGSKNNNLLNVHSKLWQFPIYVINHGSKRKKHPHQTLRDYVSENKYNVKYNTEHSAFVMEYDIDIY